MGLKGFIPTRRGKEWLVATLLFLLAWLVVTLLCAWLVGRGLGHWLELFNGATWPAQFLAGRTENMVAIAPIRTCPFYIVLGFRTTINLGIVLTAGFVLYLLSTGQLKEWFMSKLESVLGTRDTAFAAFLLHKMKEGHYEVSLKLRDALYSAAGEFATTTAGRQFLHSFLSAAKDGRQMND